ncbi:thioredoxin reductase [Schizosaccharomyces japonicus yFS275]|uniref:Thioredoxin reductase n=1 Tax=Schizosaccharomyces japonicus (strain yFS275 / FY16936) TaxID=402676 RepID=B6K6R0_SCHJY|nr:thioredoxin reductase [Schizosaccharomyces japonicus yFS275]EEB09214.1 thioredoxin reductase [Schizosaccharomyces japonicus yFS275]
MLIIGGGPAAYTAGIYLARAALKPVLFEGFMANGYAPGGQLTTTTLVENYPGFEKGIMGPLLMEKMRQQAINAGTNIITETIVKLDLNKRPFRYWSESSPEYGTCSSIVYATGARPRMLGIKGESDFWQKGISTCAVCDGALPIFRNQPVAVVGGGDSAVEESLVLAQHASAVNVFVRRDRLSASVVMARRMLQNPRIKVHYNMKVIEARGKHAGPLTHIVTKRVDTQEEQVWDMKGLFYAIGHNPATDLVRGQVDLDEHGYVRTLNGTPKTNIPGFFAAGDVQDPVFKQAITSAASGCQAALLATDYLSNLQLRTK